MPLSLLPSFFEQPTCDVARQLLGKRLLVHSPCGLVGGRIVEVEAYLHLNDAACHAAKGQTNRNRSMFGPPGRIYVYAIHNRWCMNIVTESVGLGAAVLIRAIEPDRGLEWMLENRPVRTIVELTNGPGKLCQSLGVNREYDGCDVVQGDRMRLEPVNTRREFRIQTSPRIGISQAKELPLRYFVDGHRFVSGRAADHSIPRSWSWSDFGS